MKSKTQKWRGEINSPLINEYLSVLAQLPFKKTSLSWHKSILGRFGVYCLSKSGREKSIDEILLSVDEQFVKRYKNELLNERKIKERNFSSTLSAIRKFYNWLLQTQRITVNPCVQSPETVSEQKYGQLISEYVYHLKYDKKLGVKVISDKRSRIRKFARLCCSDPKPIDDILLAVDEIDVKKYIEKARSYYKKNYFRQAVFLTQRFYRWLVDRKLIDHNPFPEKLFPRKLKPTIEQILDKHPMGERLREAIEKWLAYITRFTETTKNSYRHIFRQFCLSLPINTQQITREHIENFLQSSNVSNATKNRNLIIIKSFCHWMSDEYNLPNPTDKIKLLPKEPPKRIWLTDEQVERILSVCSQDEAKTINLLIHTGLRASELTSLQPHNFSPDLKSIKFVGKGRKERRIPLNSIARNCVVNSNNHNPNLDFLNYLRGERTRLYNLCKLLSQRAGLDFVASPHTFRRYFACSLIKNDISIYYVSKLLGHSTVTVTERYLNCRPEDLEGLTDVLVRKGGE